MIYIYIIWIYIYIYMYMNIHIYIYIYMSQITIYHITLEYIISYYINIVFFRHFFEPSETSLLVAGEPSRAGLCCLSTGERVLLLCPGMQKASRESRGFVTLGKRMDVGKAYVGSIYSIVAPMWVLYSIVGSIYIYHCWSYIFHCCFTYIAELLVSLLVNNRDWCGLYNREWIPHGDCCCFNYCFNCWLYIYSFMASPLNTK